MPSRSAAGSRPRASSAASGGTRIKCRRAVPEIPCAHMSNEPLQERRTTILSGVVSKLLDDLKSGAGDKDRRRQVEEWMRTLAEKYPEFKIETGLRDYYFAEAERLRGDFDKASDLT